MGAVRKECAHLALTDSGREALTHAARFDEDPWVRLHAATAVSTWDREAAADTLTALIVAAGGTVVRPMTTTEAPAVRGDVGTTAALCLLNLDHDACAHPSSPDRPFLDGSEAQLQVHAVANTR
jgi:hypothetical protein